MVSIPTKLKYFLILIMTFGIIYWFQMVDDKKRCKEKRNNYDKMEDFIKSVFDVFKIVNKKAEIQQDKKLKLISLVIFNYVNKLAKDYKIDLKKCDESLYINLIPVFEYISYNNIELYNFENIDITDVDMTKNEDLERFVLTHIYYITQ